MLPTAVDMQPLTDPQFEDISTLVKSICGINLHDGKKELVKARLAKRIRLLGLRDFDEYISYVRADASSAELTAMLDHLSTNLTSFFREMAHFDHLRSVVIPELLRRKRDTAQIRIWSSGCSTGEEPYSLAILLTDTFPELRCWDVKILATDLSTRVLARAREGQYETARVAQMPQSLLTKYFTAEGRGVGRAYRVNDSIRSMVTFARLNLMEGWPMKGPFDVIFCRNVMIYFDKPTQTRLVQRYHDILAPGGVLMVGHSESLTGTSHKFRYVCPAVYQK